MVTIWTRVILLGIFSAIGILLAQKGDSSSWFYFAVDALILLDYLRSGSMWPAYQAFKLQDYKVLRKRLGETFFPFLLSKTHKAKYHYLKGVLEIHDENFEKAERYFTRALEQNKITGTDEGMAYAFLATIKLNLGEEEKAAKYFSEAKKHGKSPALQQILDKLEKKINGI